MSNFSFNYTQLIIFMILGIALMSGVLFSLTVNKLKKNKTEVNYITNSLVFFVISCAVLCACFVFYSFSLFYLNMIFIILFTVVGAVTVIRFIKSYRRAYYIINSVE